MEKKFVLLMIIILASLFGIVYKVEKVHASEIIYIRADGSIDPPTALIETTDNVTYTIAENINYSIVVERDNTVIDGAGYTVQGTGSGTGIYLVDRNNVTVKNMEIKAFERGIRLEDSSNNTIIANNVTYNEFGIVLYSSSSNNTLRQNDARDNRYNFGIFTSSAAGYFQDIDDSNSVDGKPVYYWVKRQDMAVPLDAGYVVLVNCTAITVKDLNLTNNMQGVALVFTTNSTITNNRITDNFDGLRIDHSSNNNFISRNTISANTHYGIRAFYDPSANPFTEPSCSNTLSSNNITNNGSALRLDYSSNNTIFANNVANNSEEGIGFYGSSSNNIVFGNNIVNNPYGIWFLGSYGNWIYHNNFIDNRPNVYPSHYNNFWNVSYPSGGNYWSPPPYDSTDIYNGPYQNETGSDGIGDAPYSQDNYPLIGMFSDLNATSAHHVQTICNSSISDFQFNGTAINFYVSGENGTSGFCRLCIPTAMMNETYRVFVNGINVSYNLLPISNSTHSYIYFTYDHSKKEVVIISEFLSHIILPLFTTLTLLSAIFYRKNSRSKSF